MCIMHNILSMLKSMIKPHCDKKKSIVHYNMIKLATAHQVTDMSLCQTTFFYFDGDLPNRPNQSKYAGIIYIYT